MSSVKPKVLIIPSWYATPEAPTSGSFFKEQSELMMGDFDVKVLVSQKRWISWRRYYFEKYIKKYKRAFKAFFLDSPPTLNFEYDFIKFFTEEHNFEIMISCYVEMLNKLIKKNNWRPDLIHAMASHQAGVIASKLTKLFHIPYVVTEHLGPFVLNGYNDFQRRNIVESLSNADQVLAVSEHQKQHILMNGINCNPISVGNLVNDELFSMSPAKHYVFTVIFIAFYPNFIKDAEILFKALSQLKDAKIQVQIIGGGEVKGEYKANYYEELATKYKVTEKIHIIPKATRQDIKTIIEDAHILVSTSIAESFGVAICEAMLCGKPVVITANGGCNDYLIEGLNGFKVPVKDYKALAEKIIWVKNNYESFDAMKIRDSIVSKYGKNAFKERIANIYNLLITANNSKYES